MYEADFDNSNYQEERSITATFRVNALVMRTLRAESEKKQISLNAYVNQVLRHHVEWDLYGPKIGMVPFPKQVLASMFSDMDEEEVARLARGVGKNTAIDMSIFMEGKFNADTFISWIETRMRNSGWEVSRRVEKDGSQSIIIKHDLGRNWSLYLNTMLESTLNEAFGKAPNYFTTDSLVSVNFKV